VPGRWLVFRYDLEGPPPIAATTGRLSVAPAVLADPGDYQRVEQDDVLVLEVGMEGVHDGDSVMHGVIDGPRHQLPGEVVSAFGQRHRHLARGHERVCETLAARGYEPRWHIVPGTAHQAMLIVGVVEIAAGLLAALRPHIGGYVVAAWLAGIIVNLLLIPDFYDVALRDFGLFVAALALARLAVAFRPTHASTAHEGPVS